MNDPIVIRGLEAILAPSEHLHWLPMAPTLMTRRTNIPGLFDVETPDGRSLFDLTVGQVEHLARQHGWQIG